MYYTYETIVDVKDTCYLLVVKSRKKKNYVTTSRITAHAITLNY